MGCDWGTEVSIYGFFKREKDYLICCCEKVMTEKNHPYQLPSTNYLTIYRMLTSLQVLQGKHEVRNFKENMPLSVKSLPRPSRNRNVANNVQSQDQQHQLHLGIVRNANTQSPPQTYWIRNSGDGAK